MSDNWCRDFAVDRFRNNASERATFFRRMGAPDSKCEALLEVLCKVGEGLSGEENDAKWVEVAKDASDLLRGKPKLSGVVEAQDIATWGATAATPKADDDDDDGDTDDQGDDCEPRASYNPELNKRVGLYKGDVRWLSVDAIATCGFDAMEVLRAAGAIMRLECKSLPCPAPGDTRVTWGYRLPARRVFHSVAPSAETSLLRRCYQTIFQRAKEFKVDTLAVSVFPATASVAVEEVRNALENNMVNHVIVVAASEDERRALRASLAAYFPLEGFDTSGSRSHVDPFDMSTLPPLTARSMMDFALETPRAPSDTFVPLTFDDFATFLPVTDVIKRIKKQKAACERKVSTVREIRTPRFILKREELMEERRRKAMLEQKKQDDSDRRRRLRPQLNRMVVAVVAAVAACSKEPENTALSHSATTFYTPVQHGFKHIPHGALLVILTCLPMRKWYPFRLICYKCYKLTENCLRGDVDLMLDFLHQAKGVRSDPNSIHTVLRIRPSSDEEEESENALLMGSNCVVVPKQNNQKRYYFDGILPPSATQMHMADSVHYQITQSLVQKQPLCILTYGQTGSGKTHTMYGNQDGIAFFIAREVWKMKKKGIVESVSVSAIEIYLDEIQDLYAKKDRKLSAMKYLNSEDTKVFLACDTLSDLEDALNLALERRTTQATRQNHQSSRSHSIVELALRSRADSPHGRSVPHQVFLVDLAGSEKTHLNPDVKRREEGKKINLSLMHLNEMVRHQCHDLGKKGFRKTRACTLTRVLDSCLGANSKSILIACVDKAQVTETISTLRYAESFTISRSPIVQQFRRLRRQWMRMRMWHRVLVQEIAVDEQTLPAKHKKHQWIRSVKSNRSGFVVAKWKGLTGPGECSADDAVEIWWTEDSCMSWRVRRVTECVTPSSVRPMLILEQIKQKKEQAEWLVPKIAELHAKLKKLQGPMSLRGLSAVR